MSRGWSDRDEYLARPKMHGDVASDTLVADARRAEYNEDAAVTAYTKVSHAKIAGSCFVEAALTIDDPHHNHDDYRLELLDDGQAALERAVAYEEAMLESGQKNPDDTIELLRAMLNAAFYNVYADMICGELTSDTKSELIGFLEKHINTTIKLRKERRGRPQSDLSGLLGELRVLLDAWKRYRREGDEVVVPASNRADNGAHARQDTHDVVHFSQRPDSTFEPVRNVEIKGNSSFLQNNLGYLARYNSEIVVVEKDGTLKRL